MDNLFLLLSIVSLIAIPVFVISSVVSFVKKDRSKGKKMIKFGGISFAVMIVSFISFGVISDSETETTEKVETAAPVVEETSEEKATREEKEAEEKVIAEQKALEEAKAEEEANKTPVQKIESIIVNKIDKKTNMDNTRIVSIEDISDLQDGSYVVATLNGNENFTNNLTKASIWNDSKEILEPISKLETTQKVVLKWQLPLTDTYGETKDGLVMTIDLEREQLDKIKWDSFKGENFSVIANNYFEHPAFK